MQGSGSMWQDSDHLPQNTISPKSQITLDLHGQPENGTNISIFAETMPCVARGRALLSQGGGGGQICTLPLVLTWECSASQFYTNQTNPCGNGPKMAQIKTQSGHHHVSLPLTPIPAPLTSTPGTSLQICPLHGLHGTGDSANKATRTKMGECRENKIGEHTQRTHSAVRHKMTHPIDKYFCYLLNASISIFLFLVFEYSTVFCAAARQDVIKCSAEL